jgi:hypothetical protein
MTKPSVEDLQKIFPNAEVGSDGIFATADPYISLSMDYLSGIILDGEFSAEQLVAMARFVTFGEFPSFTKEDVAELLKPDDMFADAMVGAAPFYSVHRKGSFTVDGDFGVVQLQALAFWIEHPEVFRA